MLSQFILANFVTDFCCMGSGGYLSDKLGVIDRFKKVERRKEGGIERWESIEDDSGAHKVCIPTPVVPLGTFHIIVWGSV